MRIIIDTNLWISFLISKDYTFLDHLLLDKKCILLFSDELLSEFIEVVKRPKFKKFFHKNDIEGLLLIIHKYADFIDVKSTVAICRDEKDNFLLSLSKEGQADFLITGDNDLLALETFESTKIITFSDLKVYFSE